MYKTSIILLLVLFFALAAFGGCSARTVKPNESQPESTAGNISAPVSQASSQPTSSESSSEPQEKIITDPELVAQAKQIASELLERAAVCDNIYRAALVHDTNTPVMQFDGKEYFMVADDKFHTMQELTDYWTQTFTSGGSASGKFDSMHDDKVYISANGELYVLMQQRVVPLTMGSWNIDTLKLLVIDDKQIEVSMDTSLLGKPHGYKTLRIIRNGDYWLLGDSYFLDSTDS